MQTHCSPTRFPDNITGSSGERKMLLMLLFCWWYGHHHHEHHDPMSLFVIVTAQRSRFFYIYCLLPVYLFHIIFLARFWIDNLWVLVCLFFSFSTLYCKKGDDELSALKIFYVTGILSHSITLEVGVLSMLAWMAATDFFIPLSLKLFFIISAQFCSPSTWRKCRRGTLRYANDNPFASTTLYFILSRFSQVRFSFKNSL